MYKLITLALAAIVVTGPAFAESAANCEAKALSKDGKPLAGAAKTAFMKKCQGDGGPAANADCEAKAVSKDGKPLAGAAKAASIKKCQKDANAAK